MSRVLVTGGAGYIGSHAIVELLDNGYDISVVDNLTNSSKESINRVEEITGKSVDFHEFDIRDEDKLKNLFATTKFSGVIHFAGLKAVGESVRKPLEYYSNNINSTLVLCKTMQKFNIKNLIFSSSATVYGVPQSLPLVESSPTGVGITNPYGQTKFMIEQILRDLSNTDPEWSITILRYFNPVGAHESGKIGEDPNGIPNNLAPYIAQTAVGKHDYVNVFGDDYRTPDGTGIRDYIHVVDLARGHRNALEHLLPGISVYNLGTGQGTSVIELITNFSKACGHNIPYKITARRPGDIAKCYASPKLAAKELNWRAELTIGDACRDTWRWQSNNPNGYTS